MAYTINRTNNLNPIVIPDGTINTSTSLTLIGKNYPNYGSILDQNFITLLENSASASKPDRPVTGQLWWDSNHKTLKVNIDGGTSDASWKNVGSTTSQATAPTGNNNTGDLWWDTSRNQLWAWNGNEFTLVGPIGGAGGIVSETIKWADSVTTSSILSFQIGGYRYAILSSSPQFEPLEQINGFPTIYPGFNIANPQFLTNSKFIGESTNSSLVNGLPATAFMRTNINTLTTGTLTVNNNSGLYVGTGSNFHVSVATPNVSIINETTNGSMQFKVNDSGGTHNAMNIYPNGNIIANYDFTVAGNISFSNTTNDLLITGISKSTNPQTGALRLTVGGLGVAGNINTGGSQNNFVGNVTAANLNSNAVVSGVLVTATNLTGSLTTPAQGNITSVGTLTSLAVSGALSGNTYSGIIVTNSQPYINTLGTLTSVTVSGNSNLGPVGNVKITGGTSGQYLVTNGIGDLSWASISGSANQVPYFNPAGLLTGTANITYSPTVALTVIGNINATQDITAFYSTSDRRLKENIVKMTESLDKVNKINGYSYNYIDNATKLVGVIAQELEEVLPEAVYNFTPENVEPNTEDPYKAVRYDLIVPLLIEAIKELNEKIDSIANIYSQHEKDITAFYSTSNPALRKNILEKYGPVMGNVLEVIDKIQRK
jgi:hypothetical protein